MFDPRKLIPFSIEFCSAPIAVMTEMTEKTPIVIPIIVRPERSLFAPKEPRDILMISLNCIASGLDRVVEIGDFSARYSICPLFISQRHDRIQARGRPSRRKTRD